MITYSNLKMQLEILTNKKVSDKFKKLKPHSFCNVNNDNNFIENAYPLGYLNRIQNRYAI